MADLSTGFMPFGKIEIISQPEYMLTESKTVNVRDFFFHPPPIEGEPGPNPRW
jgi:hypothetical protein